MSAPLTRVSRGGQTESIHCGTIAVVDRQGTLLDQVGDPNAVTFMRSCAKPMQVLPLIESGAADRFGFTPAEIACMCCSLNAEDFQVQAVLRILNRIGRSEDDLQCGAHPPLHAPTAKQLEEEGKMPRPVHNNCAGKHAAMLALGVFHGWPTETYCRPDHPVQQMILKTISQMTEVPRAEIKIGIDGCGVPALALPLRNWAFAYAKMATAGRSDGKTPAPSGIALQRLMKAVLNHPEMIAGDQRMCTDIMRAAPGKVFAKSGAEGSYGLSLTGHGLGIGIKIADGHPRALHPTVVEVLRHYGVLSEKALHALRSYGPHITLQNARKEVVGSIEPIFHLRGIG
jgi:L-asparaginase II